MITQEVPKETLKQLRQRVKLKGGKRHFAAAAGVHENTVSNILSRGTAESVTLEKITSALKVAA